MRKQTSHPHQTSFGIELGAAAMPHLESDESCVREPATLTITVPEHLPVYTVTLRRTDVAALQQRAIVRSPGDAATIFRDRLKDLDREHLVALLPDTKNQVIGINTVSIGILDSALVHPREVFKPAIIANAASITLAHYYPFGDPMPSNENRRIIPVPCQVDLVHRVVVIDACLVGAEQ